MFAHQALGFKDQHQNENSKGKDILVFRAGSTHREHAHVRTGKGLQLSQDNAAEQSACQIADTTKHCGRKCFQAGEEANERIYPGEFQGIENTGGATEPSGMPTVADVTYTV